MNYSWSRISLFFLAIILLFSCQDAEYKPIVPDVSGDDYELTINRFEKDIFGITPENVATDIAQVKEKHPEFSEVFFHYILEYPDSNIMPNLFQQEIVADKNLRKLYDTTMIAIPDLTQTEEDLELAFKLMKHYIPNFEPPQVYTYVSGFDYMIVPPQINNTLGIGLDFFLGGEFPAYGALNFPQYVARTFTKEHIAAKVVDNMLIDMLRDYPPQGRQMLDFMILEGKRLYMLDQLLPYTPDSVKLGYTAAQTQWVKESEMAMWAEVFEQKLFDTKMQDFQKLVSTSPNSPGMPPEAPGNTGGYIGLQIVRNYMANFPETTFEQLIQNGDALKIFNGSRYKPRRR